MRHEVCTWLSMRTIALPAVLSLLLLSPLAAQEPPAVGLAGALRGEEGGPGRRLLGPVRDAVLGAAEKGTIPADQIATRAGNQVDARVLIEGPAIFGEVAAMIAKAEHEVLIQEFYWVSGCQASDRIVAGLRALQARRKAGGAKTPVRVYAVVNVHRLIARHAKRDLDRDLARAGLDPRWVIVETALFRQKLIGNLHTKSFVVDGHGALLTSANVHEKQDAPAPWYELGFTCRGPVAGSLRADFAQVWQQCSGEALPPLALEPPSLPGDTPCVITTRPADGNPIRNNTQDPAAQGYLAAFAQAKERIRILMPHLNDTAILRALAAALERGVRVEIVLSLGKGKVRVSLPWQGGTNRKGVKKLYRLLKDKPAARARLDVRWFSRDGKSAMEGNGAGVNHAKYVTVDGRLAIVGSSNLDEQAINHSREVNLVVERPDLVAAWDRQAFEPVFARSIPAR